MSAPDSQPSAGGAGRDWVFWSLLAAAVLSRLVWVLWVHPPRAHVFSDMAHYVYRAQLVAGLEVQAGMREMAWQAWGTHALLAIPMLLLGPGPAALMLASLIWALASAATVVLGYLLAARVLPTPGAKRKLHWPAIVVGLALLSWIPLISHTGFFLSETPYACALLATTLSIVRLIQDGRGAGSAGVFGALTFILRPQSALFFVLLGIIWLFDRRPRRAHGDRAEVSGASSTRGTWSRRVGARAALLFALPLLAALAISMVRFRVYTGRLDGVAENASMNLTAGRCHNIVTRAYSSEEARASSSTTGSPAPDRRVSLPGFRALSLMGPDHPLALRPALGGESIDLVGYVGDPAIHEEVRQRCYAATGVRGQLRYSVTNVALLWVIARPWPESSDHATPWALPIAMRGRDFAAWLAPLSLLGMILALLAWARAPLSRDRAQQVEHERLACLGVCALQLASLLITAAVFFGTPRLRTPYDPHALVLVVGLVVGWIARARARARV